MSRQIHMGVNIEGVLRWSDKDLRRLFDDPEGVPRSGAYVRQWLKLQLAYGKKVLPLGDRCEGFDHEKGCPGHLVEEKEVADE